MRGFSVRSAPSAHRQRAVVDRRCFCSASGFGKVKGARGGGGGEGETFVKFVEGLAW